jgi:hypothetical protein
MTGFVLICSIFCFSTTPALADQLITPVPASQQPVQHGAPGVPLGTSGGSAVPGLRIETPQAPPPVKSITKPDAPSEADLAIRKQADTAISAEAEEVADACDAGFTARIDWTEISAQDIHLASPENTCGAVLDALRQICTDSEGRSRAQAIKTVICTAGPKPALSLRAGNLLYTLDWQSQNPAAFAYAWLATHL